MSCEYTHSGGELSGWECPHPATGDGRCPLHKTVDAERVRAFLGTEAVTTDRGTLPAVGACADAVPVGGLESPIDLREAVTTVCATARSTVQRVDLRGATVRRVALDGANVVGRLDLSDAVVTDRLDLRNGSVDASIIGHDAEIDAIEADGMVVSSAVDLDSAVVSGPAHFAGATVNGPFALTNATFSDRLAIDRLTVNDDVGLSDMTVSELLTARRVSIRGELNAAGITTDGVVLFRDLTVAGPAVFTGAVFNGEARFDGNANFGGETRFEDVIFERRARFNGATFESRAAFTGSRFADLAAFERVEFAGFAAFEQRTRFDVETVFTDALFRRGGSFDGATITVGRFDDARSHGPLSFEGASSDRLVMTDAVLDHVALSGLSVSGAVDLTHATVRAGLTADYAQFDGDVVLRSTTIDGGISADGTTFETELDCRAAVVSGGCSIVSSGAETTELNGTVGLLDATFDSLELVDVVIGEPILARNVDAERLRVEPADCADGVEIDLSDSTVADGVFQQPPGDRLRYDCRGAQLGSVRLAPASDAETPLAPYLFLETRFDEFEFPFHRQLLAASDWRLHTGVPPSDRTAAAVETTYMLAKNGATAVGDHESAARFFKKELRFRRRSHLESLDLSEPVEASRCLSRWTANATLALTTGYGEEPSRVFGVSAGVIVLFTGIFAVLSPTRTLMGLMDRALLSFQSFSSFVLGNPTIDPTFSLRVTSAIEGFLGAFLIALFVFAMTRSVYR